MNNGKPTDNTPANELPPLSSPPLGEMPPLSQESVSQNDHKGAEGVPSSYLDFAAQLLDQPEVIEVWALISPLPEIKAGHAAATLDAGVWFLCRTTLPPSATTNNTIISFIPHPP
ncbi:MAG TPA: hypothetical protein VLL52_13575 [Anaerolineae bacterium]|nr:hypothetical protein [Anaerolineae bacterium]